MEQNQPYSQRLAAEVRAEAGRRGINSQSELARRAGMTQTTVRHYFYACDREPSIDALIAVAEALGVTASELLRRAEQADDVERVPVKRPAARRVAARSIAPRRQDG